MEYNQPNAKLGLMVMLITIFLGTSLYLWDPIPVQILRNATFDQFQRWQPRVYRNAPVKIIDIDDESLKRLGQWPWPRTRIAELVSSLQDANPSVIAFDIIFAESDRTSPRSMFDLWQISSENRRLLSNLPDHDQALAVAIGKSKVVLGFALNQEGPKGPLPKTKAHYVEIGESSEPYLPQFNGILSPLPMLEAVAEGNGALTFIPDVDGVVRKIPLLLSYRKTIVPSLVAETLRIAQGANNYTIRSAPENGIGLGEIHIGNITVPTTSKGEIWVNYTEPEPSRYIPVWKIFAGNTPKASLADRILLIGSSAQGLMDLRSSPLGGGIPGIEIHAQALEQMLAGVRLNRPAWSIAIEMLAITAGGLIVGIIASASGALLSFSTFMVLLAVLWAGTWYAYVERYLLIDPMIPTLMLALTFIFSSIVRHINSERRQRWVKQAFSRYISPNLVDHLITHPNALELGGRRQLCSFVFTDLTDFTSLMEKMDPSEAVTVLNVYLDRMIAIAFKHHGTLDRIVGDAVAIMFSAPVLQSDHQRRAIDCALDMQRFASQYCAELNTRGIAFGRTRIGIHTGEVIVGNFGGNTIFDYRALGDPVNTASRLEGANKVLGTLICVSEATLSGCPNILVRPIGSLLLKGKSTPLMVFELLDSQVIKNTDIREYLYAYELMRDVQLSAYEAFRQLADKRPDDSLVAFHLKRLGSGKTGDLIELTEK
ncbi:MAG: adenylate/guanylate cyclase domain-containing protein [Methylococcaceae bacterium]